MSEPLAARLPDAAARLAQLREAGAERWDAPGLAVAERLLAQTESASAALADHLVQRVHAHLGRLEDELAKSRERAAQAVSRLRAADHPAQLLVERALARGDTFLARRLLRRAPQDRPRLRDELRRNLMEQLDAQAEARGISSPGLIESPVAQSRSIRSSTRPLAMAQSLYHDAAAGAAARMTLANTSASVPPDAGRYHGVQIGARTLEEAARHPAYLKAVLARLETLGVLWHHGVVAPVQKPTKAEAQKRKQADAPKRSTRRTT